MIPSEFELVEKERIAQYQFPESAVIVDDSTRDDLERQLKRAIALGNLEHQKVRIFFEDNKGRKVVETTIWGITDQAILLKRNVRVPKNRIIKLEI